MRSWAEYHGYGYLFIGDELFASLPANALEKTAGQKVIASDLARLHAIREYLDKGYERVVWMDADFLVFDIEGLQLADEPYAVGREVWVQMDGQGKLKAYKKVHNAFLMFSRENAFLDFYIDTATRLLMHNSGSMPPQFIGPKLLTAIHNIAGLPVLETAGMFSPLVIKDMLNGQGEALKLFQEKSDTAVAGANLCSSSCEKGEQTASQVEQLITKLVDVRSFD